MLNRLLNISVLLSVVLVVLTNSVEAYKGVHSNRITIIKNNINVYTPSSKSIRTTNVKNSILILGQNKGQISDTSGLDLKTKIKNLLAEYGTLALGTYFFIYVMTLSTIFFLVDTGVIGTFGLDPTLALTKIIDTIERLLGFVQFPLGMKENPKVATIAVAWLMTKFTEPLRVLITVGIVPKIAQFLVKKQ